MFELLSKTPSPAPDTRAALIRGGVWSLVSELRYLPAALNGMTEVQRNVLKLALCEAVGNVDAFEDQLGAVQRVASAEASRA